MTADDIDAIKWAASELAIDFGAHPCARVTLYASIGQRLIGGEPADFATPIPGNVATPFDVYRLAFGAP